MEKSVTASTRVSPGPMARQSEPEPVRLSDLPSLAWKTAKADLREYPPKNRPLSLWRLLRSVVPRLERPIFVIGAPRSGTTFLGECVGALPEISYHFEPVATKVASRFVYTGEWGRLRARLFFRSVYAWLLRIHGDGDLRFAEKTPQSCFIVDFLARTFPDAQFLHIVRDGRDAAVSYSKQPWLSAAAAKSGVYEPGGYPYGPYARHWVEPERVVEFESTSDIHRCIWAWRRFTESALSGLSKLDATRQLELRYEEFVRDPDHGSARILDFLGVGFEASREAFVGQARHGRPASIGRWREELTADDLELVNAEAGELLLRLGYLAEAEA
jgi:hypothetical protein